MKFNIARMAALMALAFVLGWISYREYAALNSPATVYILPAGDSPASFLSGQWQVAELSGSTRNIAVDKDSALALVGKMARVTEHEFVFDDMHCPTAFTETDEPPFAFFRDYGMTPFLMHMHMPNARIDLGCAEVYPLARDLIFISYEGYFLEAVRKAKSTK